MVIAGLANGSIKIPGLASMFDWRKAASGAKPAAKASSPALSSGAPTAAPSASLPALDPAAMAHVIAIQAALEPHEVAYVQEVAKELSPAELRGWFDKLAKLSVPEAVTVIRGLIAGQGKNGGAS
jgi:hypothetical protein